MGVALVSCISGCRCEPLKIDAVNTDRSSELDSLMTQVRLLLQGRPQCASPYMAGSPEPITCSHARGTR
jgi:hypothetical protein